MKNKKNLNTEETFIEAIKNQQKNNFQFAENLYKEILRKDHNHFKSIFYLGTLYLQTKRLDLAKPLLSKVIQIQPNNADAHYNFGLLQKELGEYQKAKRCYEKVIQIQPNNVKAYNNFGNVLKELGEYHKAITSFEKAIEIQPNNAILYNNFGIVLKELGEYQKAISSFEKAIQIQPNYADPHNNFGIVLKELGEYQKAISSFEKAIQIQPNNANFHNNLGNALKELEEYPKAISSYEKAIQIQPNLAKAYYSLGLLQQQLGETQRAKSSHKMAAKYEPENLFYLLALSELDREILDSNFKTKIFEIIKRENSTKNNIAYGNFLLSKYELKNNEYENEFNYLLKGHQYYFKSKERKFKKEIDYMFNVLPNRKEFLKLNKYNKNFNKENYLTKPIFIIGVPRSGSTLIEKVIASGKQYIPIGEETAIIHSSVKNLINNNQKSNLDINNLFSKIIEAYKQKGLIQEKSNFIFTDKSLENFYYLSMIKEIFPHAKIINCKRKNLSSIMSTLKHNLINLAWAHNLDHIFKYYDIYYQMIENFEKNNPNFIYNLEYEKFINEPENESKKLMKFCGLPWDLKCLKFYKRKNLISKTASNLQIRKAINKDSINKYSPYNKFLSKHGKRYSWFNK